MCSTSKIPCVCAYFQICKIFLFIYYKNLHVHNIFRERYVCFYTPTKKNTPALDILDDTYTFKNRLLAHAQKQLPFHVNNCSLFQRWLPNTWSRWNVVNLTVLCFLQICSLLLSGMRLSALKILFKVGKHEFIKFEKEMGVIRKYVSVVVENKQFYSMTDKSFVLEKSQILFVNEIFFGFLKAI